MGEREVYAVDREGRVYRYENRVTYDFFKRGDVRRVWKKDLPKGFEIYRDYSEYDI